jgi:hypothetical protein
MEIIMELYKLVVVRNREKKVIAENLSKEEVSLAKADWATIYNNDVYFDPVPVLLVEMQREGEE